jgi:sphingomyelin phosphodiesterase acid-like 3
VIPDRVPHDLRPDGRSLLRSVLAFALCAVAFGGLAAPAAAQAPAKTIEALFISDVHFEPFWDPAKVDKLTGADVSDWKTILSSPDTPTRQQDFDALIAKCPSRGVDTSYGLFASALNEMKTHVSDAHFITVSGDLMAHKFDCKFQTLFPKATAADYTRFSEKTIAFVVTQLQNVAGSVPVYAALGNNDSDCGDYHLSANSDFLKGIGETITATLPKAERKAALDSFAETGSYSVSLPAPMAHARLIVLDDLFLSKNYASCPNYAGPSGESLQLAWLAGQLAAARTAHEKVWVMAHLPPGVDAYSTLKKGACTHAPTMVLATPGAAKPDALTDALLDAADVIQLGIFAHTHEDEIKLLEKQPGIAAQPKQAAIPVKLVPSISPINGNLPSITVAEIDPATATLVDYKVIAGSQTVAWTKQYDYAADYGEASFSADAVKDLVTKFAADSSGKDRASQNYIRNFITGKQSPLLSLAWPAYVCTMTTETASDFTKCACAQKP